MHSVIEISLLPFHPPIHKRKPPLKHASLSTNHEQFRGWTKPPNRSFIVYHSLFLSMITRRVFPRKRSTSSSTVNRVWRRTSVMTSNCCCRCSSVFSTSMEQCTNKNSLTVSPFRTPSHDKWKVCPSGAGRIDEVSCTLKWTSFLTRKLLIRAMMCWRGRSVFVLARVLLSVVGESKCFVVIFDWDSLCSVHNIRPWIQT